MLKERIDILKDAGVISTEVSDYVKAVIDELSKDYADKGTILEMFTTHLAMAAQRVTTNAELESLDDAIWTEVVSSPAYQKAVELCDHLVENAPCTFPEGEKRFLVMHLCNLNQ